MGTHLNISNKPILIIIDFADRVLQIIAIDNLEMVAVAPIMGNTIMKISRLYVISLYSEDNR